MMKRLLADLADAERNLRHRAARIPELVAHADALARLQALVSVRPRVILIGESNVGKTSTANLLLDQAVLPDSVVANTRRPVLLHYSPTIDVVGVGPQGHIDLTAGLSEIAELFGVEQIEVGLPSDRLMRFDLIDTPGIIDGAELDRLGLRTSDVLLWCTIATQAWKASERAMWRSLPARHRRHAILVVTHRDQLRPEEVTRVAARLAVETEGSFRAIAFLSALSAEAAPQLVPDSGVIELDQRIDESLAAIMRRRARAGYRIANHIVSDSMKVITGSRSASPLRAIAARLLGQRRPAWRSLMRLPAPDNRERRLRSPVNRGSALAEAEGASRRGISPETAPS
jgi:tRNA U34 5-carboxymethylaminomethyl modifying GTPase MnmE/TrmE